MQVTDVRLQTVESTGRLKAVSSVTFDGEFVVHDIKVIQGDENKLFIAFPSRKNKEGNFNDICHPISKEARAKVEDAVLSAYDKANTSEENK